MTLVPDSLTIKEIEDFFSVGNSFARKSEESKKEKGLAYTRDSQEKGQSTGDKHCWKCYSFLWGWPVFKKLSWQKGICHCKNKWWKGPQTKAFVTCQFQGTSSRVQKVMQ